MPLIDDATIDSLRQEDGTFRHFHLWLLGAAPLRTFKRDVNYVPPDDWRDRVLCTKISYATLKVIQKEAKLLRAR